MNYPQRMYSKTELGLLYFPDTTDGATARRHIMDWINAPANKIDFNVLIIVYFLSY